MKKFFHFKHRLLLALLAAILAVPQAWADNVAKIGSTEYATLQAAVDAANSTSSSQSTTITLMKDVTATSLTRINGKRITLDLGGYTISRSNGTVVFYVIGGSVVEITNGTISINYSKSQAIRIEGSSKVTVSNLSVSGALAFFLYGDGNNLTIESGTYTGSDDAAIYSYNGKNNHLIIDGGTLSGSDFGIKVTNSTLTTVDVNGGTITGNASYGVTMMYDTNSSSTLKDNNTLNINGGSVLTKSSNTSNVSASVCIYESSDKVNVTGTPTLDGGQVGLFIYGDNTTVKADDKFTGTVNGTKYAVQLWGNSNSFTADNGTFKGDTYSILTGITQSLSSGYRDIYKGPYSSNTVTLNGGNYKAGSWAVAVLGKSNTTNINGGTFTGNAGLCGNGTEGFSNNNFNVTGGAFNVTATSTSGAQGMYFPNNDNVSVSNCTINVEGNGQGVVVRAGDVTLGDGVSITTNGTGTTTAGDKTTELASAAVVFDASEPSYPGLTENASSKIDIKGGTYTSASGTALQVVKDDSNTGQYANVYDGTFSSAIDDSYKADGLVSLKTTDGKYQYISSSDITITDGQYSSFSIDKDLADKNITYTRTFNNTNIQPWFMPFDVDVTKVNSDATFYSISETSTESNSIKYEEVTSGSLSANTPYLVAAKEAGNITFNVGSVTLKSTTTEVAWATQPTDASNNTYKLTGIYETKTGTAGGSWYALSQGEFYKTRAGANLKPFRFFLEVTNGSASPAYVTLSQNEDPTGINDAVTTNGINANSVIYNLQGHRVKTPAKGLYIVNGKKLLFK